MTLNRLIRDNIDLQLEEIQNTQDSSPEMEIEIEIDISQCLNSK